jgi:hypothetical protein
MRRSSLKASILTVGAASLALAACNNASAPVPVLTQAQADSVAEVVATDAGALVEGTVYDVSTGTPVQGAPGIPGAPQACVTFSAVTNSDGDPVPDSVRVTFTNCTFVWGAVNGMIDVIDPTPITTDRALKTVFTDLTRSWTNPFTARTRSVKENGTRQVSGDSSVLARSETNFITKFYFANGDSAAHARNWSAMFTADVAGTIKRDSLPSGRWSLTGTSIWSHGANGFSLAVSTNPQLHFNATCTVAPRFDSGTLTAVATRQNAGGNAQTTVTIQFTACGQYTVTRS